MSPKNELLNMKGTPIIQKELLLSYYSSDCRHSTVCGYVSIFISCQYKQGF